MNSIDTMPRDTIVRLLVNYTDFSLEDSNDPVWTIGFLADSGLQFVGWCWEHDHFTDGEGTPLGWLPMIDASAH